MKRRLFLKDIVTVTTVASISSFPFLASCDDSENKNITPFIDDYLSDDDITNIINKNLSEQKKLDKLDTQSTNKISDMIKDDFINNNTIICDGWVLSQTEVKYLIQKKQNLN